MNTIKPLDHIANTKAYVPGGKLQGAAGPVAMLASNENPFGPSPLAVEAIRAAAQAGLQIYPDPDYGALRAAIAAAKGIADPARIVTSAGSDEIIHLLTQCYAGPGDEVLFTEHAFSMYEVSARGHGASAVKAPETDMMAGVNSILGAVSPRTRILFLANPNNPTGTMLSVDALKALQDALPPHVLFVVDGAYSEYLGPGYEAELRDLVDRRDTTVMMRTFSKIYGLAAARLGWAYMPRPIADTFQRIRGPFNVNALAAAAGIASVGDEAFLKLSRDHNTQWRSAMTEALNAMGLATPESHANFVVPEFGSAARAAEANQFLKDADILVRAIGGYGLPSKLRITVGSAGDNTRVLDALGAFTAKR
ncbi:pyridoxal phosphate-dependent aminotransferase [Hyphomonas sp.]|uniref:pyridoxal phosphate-dependent aminotransferase n=1 Tax=Hyphomonas sp. TaxID=87 RepID=UPI00391A1F8D